MLFVDIGHSRWYVSQKRMCKSSPSNKNHPNCYFKRIVRRVYLENDGHQRGDNNEKRSNETQLRGRVGLVSVGRRATTASRSRGGSRGRRGGGDGCGLSVGSGSERRSRSRGISDRRKTTSGSGRLFSGGSDGGEGSSGAESGGTLSRGDVSNTNNTITHIKDGIPVTHHRLTKDPLITELVSKTCLVLIVAVLRVEPLASSQGDGTSSASRVLEGESDGGEAIRSEHSSNTVPNIGAGGALILNGRTDSFVDRMRNMSESGTRINSD